MSRLTPSGLRRCSPKTAARRPQQTAAYAVVKTEGCWCLACGSSYNLTPSHILTQGRYKNHRANPLNIVLLCAHPCHHLWEHNKAKFKATYPEAWAEKLRRMQLVDRQAYAFFCMKNPTLV